MEYDLVLFGATSFVGQITTANLVERLGTDGSIRWAIAGRNSDKLHRIAEETGADVPRLVVDASDADAVRGMAEATKLIISTVGPYSTYGNEVVAACAASGTDYCDLTGEPQWMARMIDAHHAEAQSSGARIVHACGFDSIPSDLGVWYLQNLAQKKHGEAANGVELIVKAMKGGASGGTVASMMTMQEEMAADPSIRKILSNPYALAPEGERSRARQPSLNGLRHHDEEGLWLAPFVMAATNTKVVHRSHALLGHPWGEFRYSEEMATGDGPLGAAKAGAMIAGLGGFVGLSAIGPARSLLSKYVLPSPGEGPTPKQQREGFFKIILRGTTPAGEVVRVGVNGDRDPGYGCTARMLTEAALTLGSVSRVDTAGGFWTPATAMGDPLIKALEANAGMTFTDLTQ